MEKFVAYLLDQMNKTTAWIGVIGILLQVFHLQSAMFVLFVLLIVLPETSFSSTFKEWAQKLRDLDK
jgi:hypothetical protein